MTMKIKILSPSEQRMTPQHLALLLSEQTFSGLRFVCSAERGRWSHASGIEIFKGDFRLGTLNLQPYIATRKWLLNMPHRTEIGVFSLEAPGLPGKLLDKIEPAAEERLQEQGKEKRLEVRREVLIEDLNKLTGSEKARIHYNYTVGANYACVRVDLRRHSAVHGFMLGCDEENQTRTLIYGDLRRIVDLKDIKKLKKSIALVFKCSGQLEKQF